MGNLERDTALEGGNGRYRAVLSRDWEIWGPNGGYLAAIALRAAGCETAAGRPASFAAHYLSVARFEPVDLDVEVLRRGRRAASMRVSMSQEGRRILEAIVWTANVAEGLEHETAQPPEVPRPGALKNVEELRGEDAEPRFRFWDNLETRPTVWHAQDPPPPGPPIQRAWYRFRPQATFADPFVDAGRALLLIDTLIWPAAWHHHVPRDYYAPNLDVVAWFHQPFSGDEWLMGDAEAPIGKAGLIGGTTRIWTEDGRLVASGGAQLLCVSSKAFQA